MNAPDEPTSSNFAAGDAAPSLRSVDPSAHATPPRAPTPPPAHNGAGRDGPPDLSTDGRERPRSQGDGEPLHGRGAGPTDDEPREGAGKAARSIDAALGPSLVQGPQARTETLAVSRWRTDRDASFPCGEHDEVLVHVAMQPMVVERHVDGQVDRGELAPGHVSVVVPGPEVWHIGAPPEQHNDFAQLAVPRADIERHAEEQGVELEGAPLRRVFVARAPELERVTYDALLAAEHDDFLPGEHAAELFAALLSFETAASRLGRAARAKLSTTQLRRVEEIIGDRLAERLELADLASGVGLSRFHFLRAFRNSTGLTPGAYLLARRLERAQELLATTPQAIATVAAAAGFADHGHLTRQFRRRLGVTPRAYRELVRGRSSRSAA